MNDFERRLRNLGEEVQESAPGRLRPRPAALRRIRRRRLVASASVTACAAVIVAAGAFAWTTTGRGSDVTPVPPAGDPRGVEIARCGVRFEPTYVPEGFEREWDLSQGPGRQGLYAVLHGEPGASIEVKTTHYAFAQTRPRAIEVLGAPGTIGMIHEGWSVEFHQGECEYVLNAYGVTRSELRRFAMGLTSPPTHERPPAVLVWPDDTYDVAVEGCNDAPPGTRTAPQVVSRFATEVLGWESPIYEAPGTRSGAWTVVPSAPDTYGGDVSVGVRVWTTEIVPQCWSVRSVSRMPDRRPTGVGVSVRGRVVQVGYDPLGATSASIEIGYGGRNRTVSDRRNLGSVRMNLGYDPDTTGHFFVLLRDETGAVFTGYGVALPEGDFTAG